MRLRSSYASSPSAFGYYQDPWALILFVAVSVALHLTLMLAFVIAPKIRPARPLSFPSAINVRMVSLPGPAGKTTKGNIPSPPAEKKAAAKIEAKEVPPPKPEPKKKVPVPKPEIEVPKPELKKAVSISQEKPKKKKYKPKASLKKKTYKPEQSVKKKPEQSVKKTIDRLEKKVKESDSRQVKKAIDRIRKQVAQTSPVDRLKQKMAGQGGGTGTGGKGYGSGRRAIEMMDIYRAEIPYRIQENWAFSSQLAGNSRHLEAVLVVKIMPAGEIADIWFEKRSGNRYLDESAYKAVQKSSPLPPLPLGYRRPFYNLGLIFTPEGVK